MNNKRSFWMGFVYFLISAGFSYAQMTFCPEEYQSRRARFMEKMGHGIAVLQGAQLPLDYSPFYQTNDFLYLSGVEIPNAMLIVDADHGESHLFFTISEREARNDGISIDLIRHPKRVTGFDYVHALEDFEKVLGRLGKDCQQIFTPLMAEEGMRTCSLEKQMLRLRNQKRNPWDVRSSREERFVSYLKIVFPEIQVMDCSQFIWDLRVIKSEAEIALLRRAGRIAVKAHREMIRTTRAGMGESELAALFRFYLKKEGAQDLAYETIVCSGGNHPYLHYYKHDGILADGDIIVVDGGPDYHYYDIDITVTFPANGSFTARQKEIYNIALLMHEASMQVYRPGLTAEQAMTEIHAIMAEKGVSLKHPVLKQRGMNYAFGHYVGMAVHDVGGAPSELKAGMVIANEPFAVIVEENLGVRVEDTILITETGCENLTQGLPRTVEEIEAIMQNAGVVQVLQEKGLY